MSGTGSCASWAARAARAALPVSELHERYIAATNDEETVRIPLQEIQRPRTCHRSHRDAVSLDELPTQRRDVANRPQVLDQAFELINDEGLVLWQVRVRDWWSRQDVELQVSGVLGFVELEDILLAE
eukprot:CAMPEP_0115372454 /NCGR_PEP_ID=MMETSP0271-20121206/911_1 /TAXON_ID=71861 /ORGANISM="Scrippsiella trochoidea, Strain CCMP3099" /LENGTH=126 /DNA_ID=CAMNT_0002795399 /DNA_START=56 /DNA_END=437 /DNA_ORIENTATION=+